MNKCLLHLLLAMLGVLGQGGTNPTPDDVTTPSLNSTLVSSTEEPVASSTLDPVDFLNSTTSVSNVTDITTSTAGPDVNATTAAVGAEDNTTSTTPAINVTTEIPTTSKKPAPIMITDLPHLHQKNIYDHKPPKVLTTPNAPPPTPASSTTPSTPANGGFKFPDMKIQIPKIEIVHKKD